MVLPFCNLGYGKLLTGGKCMKMLRAFHSEKTETQPELPRNVLVGEEQCLWGVQQQGGSSTW